MKNLINRLKKAWNKALLKFTFTLPSQKIDCGKCEKCGEPFDIFRDSCGAGWSWYLYKCHKCKQLHAGAYEHGFIPKEVLDDKEIIIIGKAK